MTFGSDNDTQTIITVNVPDEPSPPQGRMIKESDENIGED